MTATSNENDVINKQKENVENAEYAEENNSKPKLADTISTTLTSDNHSNTVSESSISTISSSKDYDINPWTYNHNARNYAIGLITALYALILIVYGIMLFLWEWVSDVNDKDAIDAYYKSHTQLSYYHCIVSFIFFGYCYIVLILKNQRCRKIIHFVKRKLFRINVENDAIIIDNSSLMPHVGCLYLRLGAVLFGIVSVVFYAYSASLKNQYFQSNILQAIFYLIQTHFIYCSTTLFDPKHYLICRFGTMHLFSFNVAHAFQFIFAKGQQNESSLGNYAIGLITALYALIMIVYGIMLFLWEWVSDVNDKDAIDAYYSHHTQLSYYHCIVSFIFFGYCYIVLILKNQRCKAVIHFLKRKLFRKNVENDAIIIDNSSLMPHVGCLYLRLGAVLFAIVTVVFYAYSASLRNRYFQSNILKTIFFIVQTHFIYCSTTLFDPKHYLVCRFGTMHLFAINVAIAFEFIFAKGQQNESSLGKVYKLNKTSNTYYTSAVATYLTTTTTTPTLFTTDSDSSEENDTVEPILNRIVRAAADIVSNDQYIPPNDRIETLLGGFSKVFYTGIVEYNLIAAAVMFIVWHNIERIQSQEFIHKFQHKNTIRIHCSKMVYGLFGGYAFLTGTFVSMALFFGNSGQGNYMESSNIYNYTDLIQHCIGIIACVIALWRIRLLNYQHHDHHDVHHIAHSNQELLDLILLAIGLIGEMCFSISGLMGLFITQQKKPWQSFSIALAAAHISRIVQAIFQCFLICIASKAKVSGKNKKTQPGKQTITFLIILNIAIFIMNLFESDKVGTSAVVVDFYGKENWVFLVRTFSPLTVFYRFHSSVCLAKIWKNTYTLKKQH